MQVALTIAGYDPSSGAGITADLAVFAAHGLFGTSCITALTVQSTEGVRSVHPVRPELIQDTLACLAGDLPPAGIKIGLLANRAVVLEVASALRQMQVVSGRPVVLDPVLRSSSGHPLLKPDALEALCTELLPLVSWITPNHDELGALLGRDVPESAGHGSRMLLEAAARDLQQLAGVALNVLVTGGNQQTPDDLLLTSAGELVWLAGRRVETASTHGTGCALSSALLAELVRGQNAVQAAYAAKQFVEEALRRAPGLGHGRGPLELLWTLDRDRVRP